MYQKEIIVTIPNGLHVRPSAKFVKQAKTFKSNVVVIYKNKTVNAKSLFELQMLDIEKGKLITIQAKGKDEKKAVDELVNLLNNLK